MKPQPLIVCTAILATVAFALAAEDDNPIKQAMKFAHDAPKGTPKLSEKIIDGTAPEADIKKALQLYQAMADTKPPKGDPAAFKAKVAKLIAATEEVIAKNPAGLADYKAAVNCKECHQEFRKMPQRGPGGPGGFGGGPGPGPGGPPPGAPPPPQ